MTAQEIELIRQLLEKVNRLERRIGLADTLELASGGGVYTNEEAQDAVGTILTDTATIDFTYTDATPSITADVKTDSIANTLLANMAADTIKGRANGAGTGDPTDLTATQVRTIINVASGADVTGTAITALATKTTPVDADAVVITDSAASDAPKRTLWSNIKATLKTYFDTLYGLLGTANTWTKNNTIASTTTSGNALRVVRDLGSTSTDAAVVDLVQDNTGDDQPALRVQQDGSGNILNLYDGATLVAQVVDGGKMAIGSAITAPAGVLHAGASALADTVLLERTGQTTDSFFASQRLLVTKTTNMADGFGPGLAFAIQDDAAVINAIGVIGAIRSGADNTGEIVLAPLTAGVTNVRVTIKPDGKTGFTTASPDSVLHTVGTNAQAGGWTLESSAGTDADRLAIYPTGNFSAIVKLLSASGVLQFQDSSANVFAHMDTATLCTVFGAGITPGASGALAVVAGTSTNDAAVGGSLYSTVTATGNVTTGEDTLATYTVPANTLSANNMSLRFEAWGTTANNANAKTIKVKFDGVIFGQRTMATSAANTWVINGQVQRTGAATQTAFAKFVDGATTEVDSNVSLTSTLSNAIVFLITGEGTSTNDIILYGLRIWWEDANT